VFGTEKLYTGGLPPNAKLVIIKPVRGVYNIKDSGIRYVFQLKDTLFNKKSYLWVLEVTNDSRIGTPIVMDGDAPKSASSTSTLGMKTFDIYGSTIKAVNIDDGKTVMVKPHRLSFMLSADQAENLVLYSYNGQDMLIRPLTQESQVGSNFKVKAVTIDLSFGNRFTFMTADGKFPNVSPQLVSQGHPKLDGIVLVKNDLGNEPFYLFEVISTESTTLQTKGGSCQINGDCSGYYGLELPPARQALDANYPDGYIRLDVCDVYKSDKSLFLRLLSSGAIGFDRSSGANQSTVRIRWQDLKFLSPRLWFKYKNKIIYPKTKIQ